MPKTNEGAFNVELANVLRTKHPRWKEEGAIGAEQHGVFQQSALRPDIMVRHPGGLPVAVEVEFEPGRTVEADAVGRLRKVDSGSGLAIEQVIAVRTPAALREGQSDLARRISTARFLWCAYVDTGSGHRRWPHSGWLEGGVDELAAHIERASVSERLLAHGLRILEAAVTNASRRFMHYDSLESHWSGIGIAELLHQEPGVQTVRMGMAILANAMIFHNVIAPAYRLQRVHALEDPRGGFAPDELYAAWNHILRDINYWPIFEIASKILMVIRRGSTNLVIEPLCLAAEKLSDIGITSLHDMSGRLFQRLITDRKFLATFYTLPTSAALLADIAVSRLNCDWSSSRSLRRLQVADFACGTGILLSAAYHAILGRHRRQGRNDALLHRAMMERSLVAADIMPAATHLAASMLSSAHPTQTFRKTRIFTMPYGEQPDGRPLSLGSLDLVLDDSARPLFGTGRKVARGDRVGEESREEDPDKLILKHGSADLVIMNPPFTKPTNHESTTVPVPSFAGFGKPSDEQKAMSRHLARIRKQLGHAAGHGNAGLASNFFDLAHVKSKPGGVVALVLPASFVSGSSWSGTRSALTSEYRDVTVISIVTTGSTDRAFSADTGMAEVLVVATKKATSDEPSGNALFVNLLERPQSLAEASEIARAASSLSSDAEAGKLLIGDAHIAGNFVRAGLSDGGCAAIREEELTMTMLGLGKGNLALPRIEELRLPTCTLGSAGSRGLLDRDITGKEVSKAGIPRGAFDLLKIEESAISTAAYPILWYHEAKRERQLLVTPDRSGQVRPGCDQKAVDTWARTASRLHFNRDFQINSQSLSACLTEDLCIGGRAWPNFLLADKDWETAFVLCANTTLGLMSFWWTGSRQQEGRAIITVNALPGLTVLDPRPLGQAGIKKAAAIFDDFKDKAFLPANEAYRDETRHALDRSVLVDLFGLPPRVMDSLAVVRNQWCAEPTVHGGKHTRINPSG